MKTVLNHSVDVYDARYLSITDMSVYNLDIPITNSIYRITIPNFNKYVDVAYTPNTVLHVNSNLLMLTNTADVQGLCDLPSGIYTIRQSICPNDLLFKESIFFNMLNEVKKLAQLVCEIEEKSLLIELYDIRNELYLAKTLAENCCKEDKAVSLFNQSSKAITKLFNNCNCTF